MTQPTSTKTNLAGITAPFGAVRAGYLVAFPVKVGGKEILSRGEIFSMRRIGRNRMEIVLMHQKTGSMFTNVVKASDPVMIFSEAFIPEPVDAIAVAMTKHLEQLLKAQFDTFYDLPIADK